MTARPPHHNPRGNTPNTEAHAASYEATLAALVRRAGKARPNAHGGHAWTLGTGQVIRTQRDADAGSIITISVHGGRRYYEIGGIDTAKTPTTVAINILQGTIDGELDASIVAGQAAYRRLLG